MSATPAPTVPRWLFDSATPYRRHHYRYPGAEVYGIAVGFAAAGYMAGWDDARGGKNDEQRQVPERRRRAPWPASRARL